MTIELKPCPFCGGIARFAEAVAKYVVCQQCGTFGATGESDNDAAVKWNTRAESAEVERLREENKRLREGIITLRDTWHTSHYGHFDKQGTAGANCPACIADRSARALILELAQLSEES